MVTVIRKQTDVARKFQDSVKNLGGKVGKVGWFEGAKYPDGTQVAGVAATQEYGNPAKNIPPRPFMRPTINAKEQEWRKIAETGASAILRGDQTIATVLEAIGQRAAGEIRKTIGQIWTPALAERTVLNRIGRNKKLSKKKGRLSVKDIGNINKPLVDTGHMLGTLTNSVEDE